MNPLLPRLPAALVALLLLLLGASPARSDFLYHWSMTPGLTLTSGTGSVNFALSPDGPGSTFVPAAELTTSTSATAPATFQNVGYSLQLRLTDSASGASGALTFDGVINGTLAGTSSSLTNTFSNPLTQMLTLGSNTYTVTIEPSPAAVGAPGNPPTLLDTMVSVQAAGRPGVPEPSALVLGGLALGCAALGRGWRRLPLRADSTS